MKLRVPIERIIASKHFDSLGEVPDEVYDRLINFANASILEHLGVDFGGRFNSETQRRELSMAIDSTMDKGAHACAFLTREIGKEIRSNIIEHYGPSEYTWMSPARGG